MVRLNEKDAHLCDNIIAELNQKKFPGVDSQNKLIVKKTKADEISEQTNKSNSLSKNVAREIASPQNQQEQQQNKKLKKNDNSSSNSFKMDVADDNIDELADQIETLKKERSCAICFERQKVIMFMPCSHLAACVECSVALVTCPICRKKVEATIRTYI